jgi:hypothetical protein
MFSCCCLLLQAPFTLLFAWGEEDSGGHVCISGPATVPWRCGVLQIRSPRQPRFLCLFRAVAYFQDSRYDEPRRVWTSLTTTH